MNDWEVVELGLLAAIKGGKRLPKGSILTEIPGSHPYIRTRDINNNTISINELLFVPDDVFPSISQYIVETNDVIISIVGTIGLCAIIPEKLHLANLTENCAKIVNIKEGILDKKYLFYFLTGADGQAEIESRNVGSTQPKLPLYNIQRIPILLPPLPEQKAIASVLSSLDDKIDLLHRQNKTLEAMAETLFRQWFVEEAEEDWEVVPLSTYAENVRENVKVENLAAFSNYVGLEHIPRKRLTLDSWGTTDSLGSNKSSFKENDILFGKLRSYFHKVVFAPIHGVCSTDILVIRPKKNEWFSFCLFWFFNENVIEHSDLGSGGTRMPRTNWEVISGYMVPKPDNQKIIEFDIMARPTIEKMKENINQISTLEKLRNSILPKLMNGEVRVELC